MSTGRSSILSAVVVFLAVSIDGAVITTTVEGSSEPRNVIMHGQRIDGRTGALERAMTIPGATDVSLPEGLWELRLVHEELWAAPVHVRNVDSAALRVWPTAAMTGTSNGVTRLRARFAPPEPEGASGEVDCEVTLESWMCRLPTGRYDVRFSAPGMAHEFRFGVDLKGNPNPADVALRFVPGASLFGSVAVGRGSEVSVEGTEIALEPAGVTASGGRQVTRADRRGFFQFKGLAAGDYSIVAGKKGLASQASVKVLAGVAAELKSPLLLDTPKKLTVLVMPPRDPSGLPWRVHVFATDRGTIERTWDGSLEATGEWTTGGMAPGSYSVEISGSGGGIWKSETVDVGNDDVAIAIPVLAGNISGTVTLGGRPLQAQLSFGGEDGPKLKSDENGHFAGVIPPSDEKRTVLVEAESPKVRRTVLAKIGKLESGEAHMLLEMPATTLMGKVLNEDGSPEYGAILTITGREDLDVFEQALTEKDGTFQLAGYEPGPYLITAEGFQQASNPFSFDLKADEISEVELVLHPEAVLRGRMTMGNTPVIGAEIYAIPRDTWGGITPRRTTNERGMFHVALPPGTTTFDGLAVHSAFDTVMARGTLKPGREVWVQATQLGGTVIVESKRPDHLLLMHKGAEIWVKTVAFRAGGLVTAERVTLPRLEPGEYSVCSKDKSACVSGYLAPHGTLTLALSETSN